MNELSYEEVMAAYEREVLLENKKQNNSELALGRKLRLVIFESDSNGKGRKKRRRPREVIFIVDTTIKRRPIVYQVVDNEIRPRSNRRFIDPELLANEALQDLAPNERTPDALLERLRMIRNSKIR